MKASNYSLIENLRHELHQHPEVSYEEVWTKQHLICLLYTSRIKGHKERRIPRRRDAGRGQHLSRRLP